MFYQVSSTLILVILATPAAAITTSYNGQYADSCPELCATSGPNPSNWTHIHSLENLKSCTQTVLFDVNVQAFVDDPNNVITIRGCATTEAPQSSLGSRSGSFYDEIDDASFSTSCEETDTAKISVQLQVGGQSSHRATAAKASRDDVYSATGALSDYFKDHALCNVPILFAKHESAVVGMYSGSQITKASAMDLLQRFRDRIADKELTAFQVCDGRDASMTFGVYVSGFPDVAVSQDAVRGWTNGHCINGSAPAEHTHINIRVASIGNSNMTLPVGNSTASRRISSRSSCRVERVKSGDTGCADLANRCGISGNDLMKYNTRSDFCSTLKINQYYCCGPGDLPDMRPQPNPDGTCKVYPVQPNDGCWVISNSYGITEQEIESFNKQTWGWAGCGNLQNGQRICISKGRPPMPAPVAGTTCGPQVPGTKPPSSGMDFASLNPCPLNACCDVWGFCGTTAEFCTKTPADTGAPGTTRPGTSSCISNCGMDLVNNANGPKSFEKLGYFEAFNTERPCLFMDASDIPLDKYSTLHFAFAGVTEDFHVDISSVSNQFAKFLRLKGPKKVLSFGGWAFSTDQDTFQRFRQATNAANRGTFVNNLITFLAAVCLFLFLFFTNATLFLFFLLTHA